MQVLGGESAGKASHGSGGSLGGTNTNKNCAGSSETVSSPGKGQSREAAASPELWLCHWCQTPGSTEEQTEQLSCFPRNAEVFQLTTQCRTDGLCNKRKPILQAVNIFQNTLVSCGISSILFKVSNPHCCHHLRVWRWPVLTPWPCRSPSRLSLEAQAKRDQQRAQESFFRAPHNGQCLTRCRGTKGEDNSAVVRTQKSALKAFEISNFPSHQYPLDC